MDREDLKYLDKKVDIEIDNVRGWIKHYYGRESINSTYAIDMQSIELNKHLERYYHLRLQKDELLKQHKQRMKG